MVQAVVAPVPRSLHVPAGLLWPSQPYSSLSGEGKEESRAKDTCQLSFKEGFSAILCLPRRKRKVAPDIQELLWCP